MDRSASPGRPHGDGSKGHPGSAWEVLAAAARLGTTSFGGPIAHLGYFHEEYVVRRKWLDEGKYADLVAFCQMIPGPASSQLGIAIGMGRAGPLGGIAAWLGFTLPSAAAMVAFAFLQHGSNVTSAGWLHGLLVAAVAVVAQAVWAMSRSLASDLPHISLAIAAAIVSLLLPSSLTQLLLIASGAIAGSFLFRALPYETPADNRTRISGGHAAALACLGAFALFLVGLPILRDLTHSQAIALIDSFYRSGSLVFGGGHVVLPLLRQEVVPPGWVSDATFLSGYGVAQALPGPLFSFAAYLGAVSAHAPSGIAGAAIALSAIYLPSFLLVAGLLPFYDLVRSRRAVRAALSGVNATVVGILLAALYTPVWTSAIKSPLDFALVLAACLLLMVWKLRPWIIVVGAALVGELLALALG